MSCLILFKSITYAQNGNVQLSRSGINSNIIRKPASLAGKTCGYALKINCNDIERAQTVLKDRGVIFSSCWRIRGNKWVEI